MTKLNKNISDEDARKVLGESTLDLVAELEEKFGERRRALLTDRMNRQKNFDAGKAPDFDPETADIRNSDWRIDPPPAALEDRRVEITGPCDRKMVINALNCGAKVFMADLEDSHSPVWSKTVAGHVNLHDAARGSITFDDPTSGKHYELGSDVAVLVVRPRGLHLDEPGHVVGDRPVSASLFDFGVHMANNAKVLSSNGLGPFFYLPKTEHHSEARLWADVIEHTESRLGLERGVTKITLLIETLPAAFCMHEILHELRRNIVGLNCGRWDYIFSYIKTFRNDFNRILPDRAHVHMGVPFLDSYSKLLVRTCHQREAHAMGGMSAFIPIRGDEEANAKAFAMVEADKRREIGNGHDGTWVAHPGLVGPVKKLFDEAMPGNDQKSVMPPGEQGQAELIACPEGLITLAGVDYNIQVALRYIGAWLDGLGAVPIFNLMEDLATAEISRSQLWQWINSPKGVLDDGTEVTAKLFDQRLEMAITQIKTEFEGDTLRRLDSAAEIFKGLVHADELEPFLSVSAMRRLS